MTFSVGRFQSKVLLSVAGLGLLGCSATPNSAGLAEDSDRAPVPSTRPAARDSVIATVNGLPMLRSQLIDPLISAYGLPMLLNLGQLTLAKELVTKAGLTVTPADVRAEHDRSLAKIFADAPKADYPALFKQLLQSRHISQVEFDTVIETDAYLRAFAAPKMPGKITDADIRSAFGQLYGENRKIRDIELSNLAEIGEAQRRLAAGDSFEQVARAMSIDPQTARLGGELPEFASASPNVPLAIKKLAFSLPVGKVSDAISTGGAYHLIVVIKIIPPRVIKYDDVKESVRTMLEGEWMQLSINSLRNELKNILGNTLRVNDPELSRQWDAMIEPQRMKPKDRNGVRRQLNGAYGPTSLPSTAPTSAPTTAPKPAISK